MKELTLMEALIDIGTPVGSGALVVLVIYCLLNPKLVRLRMAVMQLRTGMRGMLDNIEIIINNLARKGIMETSDVVELCKSHKATINNLLEIEEKTSNPLSKEETRELRSYCDKIEQEIMPTLEEARRFKLLVEKLKQERPEHDGTWILASLAGLVLGLALGAAKKSSEDRR